MYLFDNKTVYIYPGSFSSSNISNYPIPIHTDIYLGNNKSCFDVFNKFILVLKETKLYKTTTFQSMIFLTLLTLICDFVSIFKKLSNNVLYGETFKAQVVIPDQLQIPDVYFSILVEL